MTEILGGGGAVICDGVQNCGNPHTIGTGLYAVDAGSNEPKKVEEHAGLQKFLSRTPLKLNLGCRLTRREGYVNIDNTAVSDIADDVRSFPYIHTATVDEILAIGCFQHFYAEDAKPVLEEWHRVLRPGGTLHIETTDIRELAKDIAVAADLTLFDGQPPLLWGVNGRQISYDAKGTTVRCAMTQTRLRFLMELVGFTDITNTATETYPKLRPFALIGTKQSKG